MKQFFFLLLFSSFATVLFAQTEGAEKNSDTTKTLLVDAACGQCQFKLKGKGCSLAVRLNGQAYFVDGTGIDEHGDAHAADGFCNAVRKAKVQGTIVNNRFVATTFHLLPKDAKQTGTPPKNG